MNLAALEQAVYYHLGADSNDLMFAQSYIDTAINEAIHFIETNHDCPWLSATTTLTTAAGTGAYAVPSNWSKTFSLRLPDYPNLERFDIDELDDQWTSANSTGMPVQWAVWADQIELRPIPDAVYVFTHRYYKVETELSLSTDSPQMPARFHPVIAEVATWLALRRDREDPRAVSSFNAYTEWKNRMADHANRFAGPAKVKVRIGR